MIVKRIPKPPNPSPPPKEILDKIKQADVLPPYLVDRLTKSAAETIYSFIQLDPMSLFLQLYSIVKDREIVMSLSSKSIQEMVFTKKLSYDWISRERLDIYIRAIATYTSGLSVVLEYTIAISEDGETHIIEPVVGVAGQW